MTSNETVHDKLRRLKRPHFYLHYDYEIEGAVMIVEPPLLIGVMGDFSGDGLNELDSFPHRSFHQIDKHNFDDLFARMRLRLSFAVENVFHDFTDDTFDVHLEFHHFIDFSPDNVIKQVPQLCALLDLRNQILQSGDSNEVSPTVEEVEDVLSKQLRMIMHHEKFRAIEGSWRGLHYLVENTEDLSDLQIRVLCCTKEELKKDLLGGRSFRASAFHDKILKGKINPGILAFSAIVGDYEFDLRPDDLELLSAISQVAADNFCSFLTSPSASFFGSESWAQFPTYTELKSRFKDVKYEAWNRLRNLEQTRFLVMTLPRVLARSPYGRSQEILSQEEIKGEFVFEEAEKREPSLEDIQCYCWMNVSYVLASKIMTAYAETRNLFRMLGTEVIRKTDHVSTQIYREDFDHGLETVSTNALLHDLHWCELAGLGFIPLSDWRNQKISFLGGETVYQPLPIAQDESDSAENSYAWLPYILGISQFEQNLRFYARDLIRIGWLDEKELEEELNGWITGYILVDPKSVGGSVLIELPLEHANVEVIGQIRGTDQELSLKVTIRPRAFMKEILSSFCFVTNVKTLKTVESSSSED